MIGSHTFGSALFNEPGFTSPDTRTFSSDQPFILHLRNGSDDTLLRKVEGYTKGTWVDAVNKPGSLKFSMPLDSTLTQTGDFAYPNRIWLLDGTGQILKRFVITKVKSDVRSGTFDIECMGLMYLLSQEHVPSATFDTLTGTIQEQMETLMATQDNANPISLGHIHPAIAYATHTSGIATDTTLYGAIMKLWKQIGGSIFIDGGGRLSWYDDNVDLAYYVMSLYDDIETYEVSTDFSTVINRIYAKGNIDADDNHDRASTAVINDTASQTAYGIRPMKKSYNAATPTEIAKMAAIDLAYMKDPRKTRNISAIDLARIQVDPDSPTNPHPEYIVPGLAVKVNPPSNVPNDSQFAAIIISVTRKLDDPLGAKILLGEKGPTSTGARGRTTTGSDSEFYDILADLKWENEEWNEESQDQDEFIWDELDALIPGGSGGPSTSDGDIQPIGPENEAGGANTKLAHVDHEHEGVVKVVALETDDADPTDLGTPGGLALGHLGPGAGGNFDANEGFYAYPDDGSANTEWVRLLNVRYDASWTQQSDLGLPVGGAVAYIDSGGGTDEGFWKFPPDGSSNGDWEPWTVYN